ncbi:hypothetical protein MAM1_0250c08731 [Mucor ambiguus]|uniref:Uncharacterized protein n=1 Tax=Mucor ambiguus TaxID=91626 RepID=A0A0C9MP15_9FUNG|nr:hypothetical protein MAM1_0250c08731 [Mucor ambiguus]
MNDIQGIKHIATTSLLILKDDIDSSMIPFDYDEQDCTRHDVNMPLNIATIVSFEDENKGDAVDDNGLANAVEAKVINGHAEQEAIDQMMLLYL